VSKFSAGQALLIPHLRAPSPPTFCIHRSAADVDVDAAATVPMHVPSLSGHGPLPLHSCRPFRIWFGASSTRPWPAAHDAPGSCRPAVSPPPCLQKRKKRKKRRSPACLIVSFAASSPHLPSPAVPTLRTPVKGSRRSVCSLARRHAIRPYGCSPHKYIRVPHEATLTAIP
jgi:hypothetical protein